MILAEEKERNKSWRVIFWVEKDIQKIKCGK